MRFLRIGVPALLGVLMFAAALYLLWVYPMVIVATMWGTDGAFEDQMDCGPWAAVPEEVLRSTNERATAGRQCSLMTAYYEFEFLQVQWPSTETGGTIRVPCQVHWHLRWANVLMTGVALLLAWMLGSMAWCLLLRGVANLLRRRRTEGRNGLGVR